MSIDPSAPVTAENLRKATSRRPWSAKAKELEAEHGPYADYMAWRQWFNEADVRHSGYESGMDVLGAFDVTDDYVFYGICRELADGAAGVDHGEATK